MASAPHRQPKHQLPRHPHTRTLPPAPSGENSQSERTAASPRTPPRNRPPRRPNYPLRNPRNRRSAQAAPRASAAVVPEAGSTANPRPKELPQPQAALPCYAFPVQVSARPGPIDFP